MRVKIDGHIRWARSQDLRYPEIQAWLTSRVAVGLGPVRAYNWGTLCADLRRVIANFDGQLHRVVRRPNASGAWDFRWGPLRSYNTRTRVCG